MKTSVKKPNQEVTHDKNHNSINYSTGSKCPSEQIQCTLSHIHKPLSYENTVEKNSSKQGISHPIKD